MFTATDALHEGLKIECTKNGQPYGETIAFQMGVLQQLVAELIEGSTWSKKYAHSELKRFIAAGRRKKNGEEFRARKARAAEIIAGGNELRAANGLPPINKLTPENLSLEIKPVCLHIEEL